MWNENYELLNIFRKTIKLSKKIAKFEIQHAKSYDL